MTVTPESVIKIAKGEVGTHEGYSNGHWNNDQKYSKETPTLGWSNYQAWCATFVSWVAYKAGAANLFPCTASCLTGVSWFKQRGRFSEYPAVGAQVFYGSGGGSHTGLVVAFDANTITTVEGNTNTNGSAEGDGVYLRTRQRRDSYVYGYGYPDYPGGIVSADPKWGATSSGGSSAPSTSSPSVARYKVTIGGLEYGYGAKGSHVTAVGKALVAKGYGKHYAEGPGPSWSDADTLNYADFQRSLGYSGKDADGVPGTSSLKALMGTLPGASKPKPKGYEPFPGAAWFKRNPKSPIVTAMGKRLVAEGCSAYKSGPGSQWTNADRESFRKWQRKLGDAPAYCDGWPGRKQWDALKVPKV
ncbi:CHAP domain-containing protein [Streptomyces reniochalinae]|uniref:CHAP domain-containing protein n=1 Tax=Streptomyces reniochalinae TaxID=2250578 RepID=A0A367EHY8_9ACTN|nr:peptidoglycan-binding protein [Streptomyces reniochalinae]RCG16977.1 CHAP domain-containing protein [Streptomyces reniochalinae]